MKLEKLSSSDTGGWTSFILSESDCYNNFCRCLKTSQCEFIKQKKSVATLGFTFVQHLWAPILFIYFPGHETQSTQAELQNVLHVPGARTPALSSRNKTNNSTSARYPQGKHCLIRISIKRIILTRTILWRKDDADGQKMEI